MMSSTSSRCIEIAKARVAIWFQAVPSFGGSGMRLTSPVMKTSSSTISAGGGTLIGSITAGGAAPAGTAMRSSSSLDCGARWPQDRREAVRRRELEFEGSCFRFVLCRKHTHRPAIAHRMDAFAVLLDACHHAIGQAQRFTPSFPVCCGWHTGPYRPHERLEFGAQWFRGWRGQFLEGKFRLRTRFLHANAKRIPPGVIERNVFMLLEETHLADAFGGNAAGGYIGNRAVLEFQPGMGNIHLIGQHRDSHGLHFRNGPPHQSQQNVQIMNHEIVDHIHVEAARRENAEPVHFKKERPVENRLDRNHGGIEPLDVPDLQNAAIPARCPKQRIRFRKARGHRLFNEHVNPAIHELAAHLGVRHRGYRNAYGFGQAAEFREISYRPRPEFFRQAFRSGGVPVVDGRNLDAFHFAIHAEMITPTRIFFASAAPALIWSSFPSAARLVSERPRSPPWRAQTPESRCPPHRLPRSVARGRRGASFRRQLPARLRGRVSFVGWWANRPRVHRSAYPASVC